MKASECRCIECGQQAEVFNHPEIPSHPYCNKCLDDMKTRMIIEMIGSSKKEEMKASECKCCECGQQAVAFWPCIDPDIPSHPYCRKCLDKAKMEMMVKLNEMFKK